MDKDLTSNVNSTNVLKQTTKEPSSTVTLLKITQPINTVTITSKPSATDIPMIRGCVIATQLRIRMGPGSDYGLVGGLVYGNCVFFDGRSSDSIWLRIVDSQISGWVASEFIKLESDISALPIILIGQVYSSESSLTS
jgi:uncharacterized protein YraI